MARIEWTEAALRDLETLDKPIARRISRRLSWFSRNFQSIVPKPLSGELKGTFKLRVQEEVMRINYDEKTDSLYVRLKETPYYESDEVKEGVLLDYDDKGNLIAIEILDAREYLSADELASLTYNLEKAITR